MIDLLLYPIYKLGDWLVKRDMEKWGKTFKFAQYRFVSPLSLVGEPHSPTSHFATMWAVEDYFKSGKEGK